jgi:hypothetical protein
LVDKLRVDIALQAGELLSKPPELVGEDLPQGKVEAVFESVNDGACDAGMIPIENSLAGSIHRNYDLLLLHELRVIGEHYLPIHHCLIVHPGVALEEVSDHHDLMYDCWRYNLKGGLKVVEQRLGITRQLRGIDGSDAVELWWRYQNHRDRKALRLLLQYNKEDVMNLKVLRRRLGVA